ncbi:TLC domain-containing protein 4-B isoform X2 [Vitis riparia]|uniref:TLC domain-containing protein 4-B isoform X2 n=1 Tax=Vitis riparia TaxID=96939 RepID=UPI00155B3CDC|nr:TLC domain-containing protein 4-B isoform X2 [Vitis riparia]
MVGLPFHPAFMGLVSSSKEFHWMTSVFFGMIFCKIVYELTGLLSNLCFKGYTKLSNTEKVEWNNRGFSTFHAIIVAVASLYLLLVSDLFDEDSHDELIINRASTLSDTILGISIGYFLSDLAMILWNFPALGGLEYALGCCWSEEFKPIHLQWHRTVLWVVARILLFIFFFYHMIIHFDEVKKIFPLGFYSLLIVPPVLAMMNAFWFWKIAKGLIKTLSKARHSQ